MEEKNEQEDRYPINEIFTSLQGEGSYTGHAMNFVRIAGCNLRCHWCDQPDSVPIAPTKLNVQMMSIPQICAQLDHTVGIVCLTGGEPTTQNLIPLIKEFHKRGYQVHLETNGTRPIPDGIDHISMSPHFYTMDSSEDSLAVNNLPVGTDIKLVIDGHFMITNLLRMAKMPRYARATFWLMPLWDAKGPNEESVQRCYEYTKRYSTFAKVGLQAHKVWNMK